MLNWSIDFLVACIFQLGLAKRFGSGFNFGIGLCFPKVFQILVNTFLLFGSKRICDKGFPTNSWFGGFWPLLFPTKYPILAFEGHYFWFSALDLQYSEIFNLCYQFWRISTFEVLSFPQLLPWFLASSPQTSLFCGLRQQLLKFSSA